jgi:hypothetical protein
VDRLQAAVQDLVALTETQKLSRREIFTRIWRLAHDALGIQTPVLVDTGIGKPIPRLSEPWYCCAEPTHQQLQSF